MQWFVTQNQVAFFSGTMIGLESKLENDVEGSQTCRYCKGALSHCRCRKKLGAWWKACQVIALLQPSSAASERVFSLLKNYFGDQQYRSYADIIFLSLALSFNKRDYGQFNFDLDGE